MNETINVFLIYTKKDSAILLQLLRHLDSLKDNLKIHFWYDDPVYIDKEWSPQIVSRFEDADVYLLLVSNALMYSKFIEQVEFKMIIDKYKVAKSKVVPIILENCPWDIDFEADEYTFNLKELHVLPEAAKPVNQWESPDRALQSSADHIKKILKFLKDGDAQKPLKKKWEAIAADDEIKDQLAISFSGEKEADERASAEKRVVDEQRRIKEANTKRKASEEQQRKEAEIAAKKWEEEENRLRAEATAKRKAQHEAWLREQMEEKPKNQATEQDKKNDGRTSRKRVLLGFSAAALIVLLIVLLSRNSGDASQELAPQSPEESIVINDSDQSIKPTDGEKPPTQTLGAGASLSKLDIGSRYKNGLVFEVGADGKKGKIVHTDDFGPMIWNDAMKIDEQLGEGWRLPTQDELKIIYKTLGQGANNVGEFADELYWSATPYDANQARLVRFSDGNTSYHYNSIGDFRKFRVRAVRDF